MVIGNRPQSASVAGRVAACGGRPAGNARHAAAYVIGVLEARRASADDFAVSLLERLERVEHAEREDAGLRGSEFPPRGRPSPGRRLVEMLLMGVYSLKRGNPATTGLPPGQIRWTRAPRYPGGGSLPSAMYAARARASSSMS